MRIWHPKNLKQPCHKNGYLQTASDARKHRDRFKLNPLAKIGSLFVPQPLRLLGGLGHGCCCRGGVYTCAEVFALLANISEVSVTFSSNAITNGTCDCCATLAQNGVYQNKVTGGGIVAYYWQTKADCSSFPCTCPAPFADVIVQNVVWFFCSAGSWSVVYQGGYVAFYYGLCYVRGDLPVLTCSLAKSYPFVSPGSVDITPLEGGVGWGTLYDGSIPSSITLCW